MSFSIRREFRFEAAHRLPCHEGKCNAVHGHSYRLEVEVGGVPQAGDSSEAGMIMDFGNLKTIINRCVIDRLDHAMLNDFVGNPTAEELLAWMVPTLIEEIALTTDSPIYLSRLQLWETENCSAVWRRDASM